jgi:hypothetical protein
MITLNKTEPPIQRVEPIYYIWCLGAGEYQLYFEGDKGWNVGIYPTKNAAEYMAKIIIETMEE